MSTEHTVDGLGPRLRQVRQLREMSQEQLARLLDIGSTMLSLIETGQRLPSLRCFAALCRHLGVSADFLLNATPPIEVPGPRRAS